MKLLKRPAPNEPPPPGVVLMTLTQEGRLLRRIGRAVLERDEAYLRQWPWITRVYFGPRTEGRRPEISLRVKLAVWERDGGRCVRCASDERIEYDHVFPFILGGKSTVANLQLLCRTCNRRKGARVEAAA